MVDTDMQRELREDHVTTMDAEMHSKFTTAHKSGKLLKPEQPGHVMAKLVLDAPKDLSGRFLSYVQSTLTGKRSMLTGSRWDDKELDAFQG